MTLSVYPAVPVDRERLMDQIRALQVDLTLLADWLARDAEPALPESSLWHLACASQALQNLAPARRQ